MHYEQNRLDEAVYHFSAVIVDQHQAHFWAVQDALCGLVLTYQARVWYPGTRDGSQLARSVARFADLAPLAPLLHALRKHKIALHEVDKYLDAYLQGILAAMDPVPAQPVFRGKISW